MDRDEILTKAKELRQAEELEESLQLLEGLLTDHPDDPLVLFEVGGGYDVIGLESEAIPFYKQAVEEGLDGENLEECLICIGACHRAIGEFQESVDVLEAYADRFPDRNAGLPFLALAYYSNRQYSESVRLLLELLLDTTSDADISSFADTLDYYREHLDDIWDE